MATIVESKLSSAGLRLRWDDGVLSDYLWIWLRDHAVGADSMHPITFQRQLYTAGLAADLTAESVRADRGDLVIEWSVGDSSCVPLDLLVRCREPERSDGRAIDSRPRERRLWSAATLDDDQVRVDHREIMSSEAGLLAWLERVHRFGFAIATDTPSDPAATEALLRRVGYVRQTIFGGMWQFSDNLDKADTAYTTLGLRPHTDGTYSHDAPGLQLLQCLRFDGEGGESVMVDGFETARRLAAEHPQHFATLSTTMVPGQYIGDGSHLMARRPVFRHDDQGQLVQVSFNNADRAPFILPATEMAAFYGALRAFETLVNDPAMQWCRRLQTGEAMLFDNWRLLHGRRAYTGQREMAGGYVNREDYESRLRRLLSPTG